MVLERFRRLFKLAPVRSPNKHSEDLVWIWFIKVDEGGLSLAAGRIVRTATLPHTVFCWPKNLGASSVVMVSWE